MLKVISVIRVILPIFTCMFLGIFARRNAIFTQTEIQGFQRFVVKFGLPCLLFQSCLTAQIGIQALSGLIVPVLLLIGAIWGFRVGKRKYPYHNVPFVFCCKETGMVGIPLFIILFGADQAYRMGILDMTQAIVVYPVIAMLSAAPGTAASPRGLVKKMMHSPLIVCSLTGLALNLSGVWNWMQSVGIHEIVTDTASYIAQPVSAMMIFCVGYNFSLEKDDRKEIFRIVKDHLCLFAALGILFQVALFLFPNVDALTRWTALLYACLPASFLTPSFGREEKDFTITSGVCSVLTLITLLAFCVMAVIVS